MISSLNHPNICTLYERRRQLPGDGAGRSPRSPSESNKALYRSRKALNIARQISEALDVPHEIGIVHRDLKPANIKIKSDSTVKVLDFGLAKVTSTGALESGDSTLTENVTQAGAVLGTASYMAPEQAQGRTADKRADIWAFGVVVLTPHSEGGPVRLLYPHGELHASSPSCCSTRT